MKEIQGYSKFPAHITRTFGMKYGTIKKKDITSRPKMYFVASDPRNREYSQGGDYKPENENSNTE